MDTNKAWQDPVSILKQFSQQVEKDGNKFILEGILSATDRKIYLVLKEE